VTGTSFKGTEIAKYIFEWEAFINAAMNLQIKHYWLPSFGNLHQIISEILVLR
jgi:hypothetical protein